MLDHFLGQFSSIYKLLDAAADSIEDADEGCLVLLIVVAISIEYLVSILSLLPPLFVHWIESHSDGEVRVGLALRSGLPLPGSLLALLSKVICEESS